MPTVSAGRSSSSCSGESGVSNTCCQPPGTPTTSAEFIRLAPEGAGALNVISAIIVDFRGLTRPYVVTAIGDPGALGSELDTGTTGDYLAELADRYGIVVQLDSPAEVNVPAAARLGTRVADVAPPEGPDTTPNPTQEDPG